LGQLEGSAAALVAIVRREVVERYGCVRRSGRESGDVHLLAAAITPHCGLFGTVAARGAGMGSQRGRQRADGILRRSTARPVFSATFDTETGSRGGDGRVELRWIRRPNRGRFEDLLGAAPALPYAAALVSACPRAALPLNVLP